MSPSEIEAETVRLDAIYRSVATRPVELDALADLGATVAADLARLGVADEAEGLLRVIVERYGDTDEPGRAALRGLFDRNPSFRWAAQLPADWATAADFRDRVLLVSAHDQGADARDEIMALRHLAHRAAALGIAPGPVLVEVAELSSTVDRYGMGSMRDILRRIARESG